MNKFFTVITSLVLCGIFILQPTIVGYCADKKSNTTKTNNDPTKPTGLLLDLMEKPMGISSQNPSMSWIVNDKDNDEIQTAYNIIIASSQDKINKNIGDIFNSGKIKSANSSTVKYDGKTKLQAGNTYYWKVRTWDKNNNVSPFSDSQRFTMAVSENWSGKPIWSKNSKANVIFARKDFDLLKNKTSKDIDSAIVSVTANKPGFGETKTEETRQYGFKMYMNGEFVGLGPHFEGYQDECFYNTFDVTNYVKSGNNTIGAICYLLKGKQFVSQLKITYKDGKTQEINSDNTWKVLDGTKSFGENDSSVGSSVYVQMAENINAKIYPFNWNKYGFDDSKWEDATISKLYTKLIPSPVDPVVEEEISVKSVIDKGNGNYFIDLGKEIIGGIKFTINENNIDNTKITILYGEELEKDNTVKWEMRTRNNYKEEFTLKNGNQTIENFGMKNFRYIEIENCPTTITTDEVKQNLKGVAIHQSFNDDESYFTSNNQILNDVYDFCKYSIKATTQDIYVDSQSRERAPYEGDAYINQLSQYSFSRDYSVARFTNQFLAYHPQWCTEYSQMNVMSFYLDYLYTGNDQSITDYYDLLKTKVLDDKINNSYNLIDTSELKDLVDWPKDERDGYKVGDKNPYNTVINSFNYKAATDLSAIATVLNKDTDAKKYSQVADKLKLGINNLYNDKSGKMYQGLNEKGKTLSGYPQHASFFPVSLGAVDDSEKVDALTDYISKDGIQCSVYGAQFYLTALYNAGKQQEALDALTSTGKRSWYHQINDLDATITCEAWDPSLKKNMTFSHAWGSAPANVIVKNLCGINPIKPQYDKVEIKPQIADLQKVSVKVPNIKGYILMDIDTTNKDFLMDMSVTIPTNSTSKVYVPATNTNKDLVIVDGKEVTATRDSNYLVIDNVGSGTHTFKISIKNKSSETVKEKIGFFENLWNKICNLFK